MALSNQWFGIADSGGILRATTADDTSTAWAANSLKSLAIGKVAGATATTYTIPGTAGTLTQMFLVANVNAAQVPTLAGVPITVGASAIAPKVGNSTASSIGAPALTDGTVTYTFAATTGTVIPFMYVN